MAMIPITKEQREEADQQRIEALLDDLAARLNGHFSEQLAQVGETVAVLVAQLDRPRATTH